MSLRQIAKDFGIFQGCLHRWLKIAGREDGLTMAGASPSATRPLSRASSRIATQLLERENDTLRRAADYMSRDILTYPLVVDLAA